MILINIFEKSFTQIIKSSSPELVAEGYELVVVFVEHNIEHRLVGQCEVHTVDLEVVPFSRCFLPVLEGFMAFLDVVGGHVSVEVVDVVVLDAIGEGSEQFGNVQKCTALKCRPREVPFLFPLTVW
jgi:hypothetical protein